MSTLSVQAADLRIAVVLSAGTGPYQEFAESFKASVSANHQVQIVHLGEEFHPVDMVVAVGMKATVATASLSAPVLSVLVPRFGFEGISRAPTKQLSAIFIDQPMARRLSLIRAALPQANAIGVLISSETSELAAVKQLAPASGFGLHIQAVATPEQLAGSLSSLLSESDVLLVLPDAAIYRSDTIRNILLETYRQQVPMIGLSQNYVRAGALCAVYSTPLQFAEQTARVVAQFAKTRKLPDYQYPNEFEVAVNTQVARSLGLTIKSAEQLRAEIGGE